jgi:cytochrome c6
MKLPSTTQLIHGTTVAILIVALGSLASLSTHKALAASSGEKLFTANCAACHANGGNIVDPKKPLKGSQKLASKEVFKDLLKKPVGAMPAFANIADSDADLTALYNYCKSLK